MFSLFCRTHCCGFNTFYRMSKFNLVLQIWPIQSSGSWLLYIGNRGVTFGDFFTIFAYKILNIDVETTKFVSKMQTMNRITTKILKMKNVENFGQNWANFNKKCLFLTKIQFIQNDILRYNLSYSEAIAIKYKKFTESGIFNFWLFSILLNFS